MEARRRLGLSYRQVKRVWARHRAGRAGGLVPRRRWRELNPPPEAEREACLPRYRKKLVGFGPTLVAEELAKRGFVEDYETLCRWLIRDGQ